MIFRDGRFFVAKQHSTIGGTLTKQLFSVKQFNGTDKPVPYGGITIEAHASTTLEDSRRESPTIPPNCIQ